MALQIAHARTPPKLLTCRYWAFGSRCPDEGDECQYAHWDTGRLSDFSVQRGTCWFWAHGNRCHFGHNCVYEHRHTGMMRKRSGVMVLYGLNLQIAQAAESSGFDVRDTRALMDLIWAVRRVVYAHGRQRQTHKPTSKIYPDRYRPSQSSTTMPTAMKRGRVPDDDDDNNGNVEFNTLSKRRKIHTGQMGRYAVEPDKESRSPSQQRRQVQPEVGSLGANQTMRELKMVERTLQNNIKATLECMISMGQLWEQDSRIRSKELEGEIIMLKADLGDADKFTSAAVKGIQQIQEMIEDIKFDKL